MRERTQQLGIDTMVGQEVFGSRRCRNSYGVAVRIAYDELRHKGLPVFTDPHDNRRWVDNLVE